MCLQGPVFVENLYVIGQLGSPDNGIVDEDDPLVFSFVWLVVMVLLAGYTTWKRATHVPAVLHAFTNAWRTTFLDGVLDHEIKELCRVYVSQSIACEY